MSNIGKRLYVKYAGYGVIVDEREGEVLIRWDNPYKNATGNMQAETWMYNSVLQWEV
jgi:hypothetical protein